MTNELQIFNQDVIPVYTTDKGEKVVMGRELHERLKINTAYADWIKRMAEYGFEEGTDYSLVSQKCETNNPKNPYTTRNDHVCSLDMAKHIAMIQRTPEGFAIRQKLIELDKQVQQLSELDIMEMSVRELKRLTQEQNRQAAELKKLNGKVDSFKEVIALNPVGWRDDARSLIVKIAETMGGTVYIREVNNEIYRLVDVRAGVSLKTRLENKRRRMAEEGVCKSKRQKLSYLDVIADDKKLIEIYTAIVKEMSVKYLEPTA